MPAEEIAEYGIGVGAARPGRLEIKSTFPGEIALNADKMAHIVPRVAGIVREVKAHLGHRVQKGDIMAVIDSRELADAKADFLASMERLELTQANFDRQERLWQKEVTSEKEYLASRQNLAEAKINIRAAKQKLIAMGFTSAYLETLPTEPDELFTRYEVVAPIGGTVIEKKIAFGEVLKDDAEVFIVADLSTVWINLQVFKKDLPLIREKQRVSLTEQSYLPDTDGVIDYVGPLVGAETQTAIVRVVQPNPSGRLRPGLFVNAHVTVKSTITDVLVHKDHILYFADTPCVFVQVPGGFELRGVTLGNTDGEFVAITKGLAAGEKYATKNVFLLKAELDKSSVGLHVHADGTVH
jgi:cobalt-zinc-cadmium efflux system membrane fusion protein